MRRSAHHPWEARMTPARTQGRTIGVVYTGGTFGMQRSKRGYVPSTDLPRRVEAALAETADAGLPDLAWLDHGWPPVNSADLEPRFWFDLAAAIARAADAYDGFVVIHGTDTLAYTGSALSFLLAGLDKPVVVTGAAAPLGEAGSDALDNLRHALQAAADDRCREVGVAFRGRLLRANRASKRHGLGDDPFDSPCCPPLAEFDEAVRWHDAPALPEVPASPVPTAAWQDTRVALLSVYPGMDGDVVQAVAGCGAGALLLEGYAAGIGPGGHADFVRAIEECVRTGVVVGAISQSRTGYVRLGKYAVSTPLAEAGVVGGADMTREAALTKLHVLLAQELAPEQIAAAFGRDWRGELTAES